MNKIERYLGCVLGLATGDAVGTTVEFRARGTFEPVVEMTGGGPFGLRPGEWTDDTSMALCLAASLSETGKFDSADQMSRYCRWLDEGYMSSTGRCFDIGTTTRAALRRFQSTGNPIAGSTEPQSAGNGSLMRLAPVVLCFADEPRTAMDYSAESSRTTHGATAAVDSCRYFSALLLGAIADLPKEQILSVDYSPVPGYWQEHPLCPEVQAIAHGSFKEKDRATIKSSGYVIHTLEAALWAFFNSRTFQEGCLSAVNLGEDADTIGAVYGQIAGAFYGVDSLPETWRAKLAKRDLIEKLARDLHRKSARVQNQASVPNKPYELG